MALIAAQVKVRFALDGASFAEHLLDLARSAPPAPGRAVHEHLGRLSLDDLYLTTACARGEEKAWEEFGARYFAFIRRFARRFLPQRDAVDLADQVIADLWGAGKLARYEGRSTLRTWLGAVVAHAAVNSGKAARRQRAREQEDRPGLQERGAASGQPAVLAEEARSLLGQIVTEAIGALPADEKLLLLLYYEQGLTLDEMAVALRSSKAALSRRLKRTREGLRGEIESLARRSRALSADALREGIDLGRVELDLAALLASPWPLEGR